MEQDLKKYSPVSLAFLGDGVYGLHVRAYLVKKGNARAKDLHKRASSIVSARAQAKASDAISEMLTDEEADILRRGTNAHVSHQAKNASSYDYHKATGLEALFGYLYLTNKQDRIEQLIEKCIEYTENPSGEQKGFNED